MTLPAFHWVSVYLSASDIADSTFRQTSNHKCEKIYEKYMVAYRGTTFNPSCDKAVGSKKFQGVMKFDVSSLTWTTKVELESPKYLVPQALYETIGGE